MKMIVQSGEIQGETKSVLVAQVKNSNTVMEKYKSIIFATLKIVFGYLKARWIY